MKINEKNIDTRKQKKYNKPRNEKKRNQPVPVALFFFARSWIVSLTAAATYLIFISTLKEEI